MRAAKKCGKCGYIRKSTDTAPDWECPECGVVYEKFESVTQRKYKHPSSLNGSGQKKVKVGRMTPRSHSAPSYLRIFGVIKKVKELLVKLTGKISQEYAKEREKSKSPLFRCKDCGREISKRAESCPGCGASIRKKQKSGCGCAGAFLVVFILFLIGFISSSLNQNTSKTVSRNKATSSPSSSTRQKNSTVILASEQPTKPGPTILKSKEQFQEDSKQICYEKWTKRGNLDREMYNYCIGSQMEGYRELLQLHKYAEQPFYSETSFPYCKNKWTKRGVSDVKMMAHCLNQEIEGVKDVMYYREQYGEEKVNAIAGNALARFHSWNMAAYSVKQYFQ